MSVVYCNHIKISDSTKDYYGIVFEDDNSKFVYIGFRVVPYSRLESLPYEITQISSKKLPCLGNVIVFTNGRGSILGSINVAEKSYKGRKMGGIFESDISLPEMIARMYSKVIHNDIKVYKIEGMKI